MKTTLTYLVLALIFASGNYRAGAQGTAFTYQGRLNNGGTSASGLFDFQFALYTAGSGGSQIGSTDNVAALGVTNGLFTTLLDFGNVYSGSPEWLQISVRTNATGNYVSLMPRQSLNPIPYSIYSANAASANAVAAGNIVGTVPLGNLPPTVLTNNSNGIALNGAFSGDGSGLSNVNSTISNTITNPIPVMDVQNPPNQPFATNLSLMISSGSSGDSGNGNPRFYVPTNKVLVIECISGYLSYGAAPSDQYQCFLNAAAIPSSFFVAYGCTFPPVVAGLSYPSGFSQLIKAYAYPGSPVYMNFFRSGTTATVYGTIGISGYYVNAP